LIFANPVFIPAPESVSPLALARRSEHFWLERQSGSSIN
jgi:hypothetical protein